MNGLPLMFLLVFGLGWALASWWAAVKPGGFVDRDREEPAYVEFRGIAGGGVLCVPTALVPSKQSVADMAEQAYSAYPLSNVVPRD